jgi:large repetitive protein
LLDALSYEGAITAATIDGQTYDLVEGTALADTVADSNTVDGSLSRIPDTQDGNDAASDWAFTSTKTPAAANVATP